MKRIFTRYTALLIGFGLAATSAFAQTQPPLVKRDMDQISFLAKERLTLLNELMNLLTDQDLEAFDKDYLIKGASQPNDTKGSKQVFYNDLVTIEDDIDPNHTAYDKTNDVQVDKYLTNLNAWRMDAGGGESQSSSSQAPSRSKAAPAAENFPADPFPNYSDAPPVSSDDLPF